MKDKKNFGMLSYWKHPEVLYKAFALAYRAFSTVRFEVFQIIRENG